MLEPLYSILEITLHGIRETAHKLIKSYFTKGKQLDREIELKLRLYYNRLGVSQYNVADPIPFLNYINDLPENILMKMNI